MSDCESDSVTVPNMILQCRWKAFPNIENRSRTDE